MSDTFSSLGTPQNMVSASWNPQTDPADELATAERYQPPQGSLSDRWWPEDASGAKHSVQSIDPLAGLSAGANGTSGLSCSQTSDQLSSLPVGGFTTKVLLVPNSIQMSSRRETNGVDTVNFDVHFLVPPGRNCEECEWTNEAVERELRAIMLAYNSQHQVLFNIKDKRGRGPDPIERRDPHSLAHSSGALSIDSKLVQEYNNWVDFHVSERDKRCDRCRTGFRGLSALIIDLHSKNKQGAQSEANTYRTQGGLVYTEALTISRKWTQELHPTKRNCFTNLTEGEVDLVLASTTIAGAIQPIIPPLRRFEDLLLEKHNPATVELSGRSAMTPRTRLHYSLPISPTDKTTLDDYIRQRSVIADKLRHIASGEPILSPSDARVAYFFCTIPSASTHSGSLSLMLPWEAEQQKRKWQDDKCVVMEGFTEP